MLHTRVGRGLAIAASALLVTVGAGMLHPSAVVAEPYVVQQLVKVADDVYMFSMTEYNSFFIVSDDGVLVVDPCGPERAPLLKAAIASITAQPVRYVVYAHDHIDHAGGGAVFADTAQFVSQRNAVDKIAARGDPLSPVPTIAFDDFLELDLGGKAIDLYYVGLGHSDNNLLLIYPEQRLAFGADFIETQSLFTGQIGPWLDEWMESFRWIEANLDFDTLVTGHGIIGTKDSFRQAREYFENLIATVRAARAAGLEDNSPEMVAYVRDRLAPTYGTWGHFQERITANVGAIVNYLDRAQAS